MKIGTDFKDLLWGLGWVSEVFLHAARFSRCYRPPRQTLGTNSMTSTGRARSISGVDTIGSRVACWVTTTVDSEGRVALPSHRKYLELNAGGGVLPRLDGLPHNVRYVSQEPNKEKYPDDGGLLSMLLHNHSW